jgi:uncharacterized membrane protein
MPKVDGGIVVHRPVGDVFAYATSAESHLRWVPGIRDASYIDDEPPHEGSRWRVTVTFGGFNVEAVNEVVEFVPERVFAWRSVSGPMRSSGAYRFSALADDVTRFDYMFSTEDRLTMLSGFALPMALRLLRREVQSRFERIKVSLEAGELSIA